MAASVKAIFSGMSAAFEKAEFASGEMGLPSDTSGLAVKGIWLHSTIARRDESGLFGPEPVSHFAIAAWNVCPASIACRTYSIVSSIIIVRLLPQLLQIVGPVKPSLKPSTILRACLSHRQLRKERAKA